MKPLNVPGIQHRSPPQPPSSPFPSDIGIRYKDLRDGAEDFPNARCPDQGVVMGTEIRRSGREAHKSSLSGFEVGKNIST